MQCVVLGLLTAEWPMLDRVSCVVVGKLVGWKMLVVVEGTSCL